MASHFSFSLNFLRFFQRFSSNYICNFDFLRGGGGYVRTQKKFKGQDEWLNLVKSIILQLKKLFFKIMGFLVGKKVFRIQDRTARISKLPHN